MSRHKLPVVVAVAVAAALLVAPAVVAEPPDAAIPTVPQLTDVHRNYLVRLARRTLHDRVLGRESDTGYTPASLPADDVEVVVRLRQNGFLRAAGVGGPGPLPRATRDATLAALSSLKQNAQPDADLLSRLMVEVEVAGKPVAVPRPEGMSWTDLIDGAIEPGIHGVVLAAGEKRVQRFCPTELFTSDMVIHDAIARLAQGMGVNPSQTDRLLVMRFRTDHFYEDPATRRAVPLVRGMTTLPPEQVNRANLDAAVDTLAEYMRYRQKPDGSFSYQYEPALNVYSEDDNVVRQAGAAVAMCVHARVSGLTPSREAADRALAFFLDDMSGVPEDTDAAFVPTPDGSNKLGVTALIALALAEHPDAEKEPLSTIRHKLVNGMLWLQRPSGMFLTAFPPARSIAAQDYFPGEALLALARHYRFEPTTRVNDAFVAAIDFYREYFRDKRSPAFVPWQVQAFSAMAPMSKRDDYAAFVFEMTDWLAAQQITPHDCEWPDMWGGIASYTPGRAGVSTATYLEGFADALELARQVGDTERAKRYEEVVRAAARFVMQLQVRPEETYFMRSRIDAVGGIRTSPSLDLLRIDHCQHALIALIKTRRVLYGE